MNHTGRPYGPSTGIYLGDGQWIPGSDLTDEGLLFNGFGSEFLEEPGKLPSDFLSQLVKAGDEGLNQVQVISRWPSTLKILNLI